MQKALFLSWLIVSLALARGVCAESLTFQIALRSDDKTAAKVLKATKGDRIVIEWSTEKPMVVHVHAYDIEQELTPGKEARSDFTASVAGRFPIEAHPKSGSGRKVVAYLEVQPR